ncbi:tetratricopeptide repeat protein [Limnospira fusiformis SAG 85.79]|uniref:Tetratricopeptide repeat protein n=4 Tax=Limnospira TaxID=2596745 RepID=A0A9P1NZW7_9CYAN|nr:tetratricopeptide TPR_2 repeat protein [Arthrospira platensis C1]QJB27455.1 tetratricopeptide repeat protein [Limnospira fusiformis SAG 85.79]QNH59162.1 MAG: tetratricopeptide repeat protein [Limnospira indica BM01]CDM94106.1 hypothetical protein ARTHRO_11780 [Limnospira indica PCC 8005]
MHICNNQTPPNSEMSKKTFSCMVSVTLLSGSERNVYLVLDQKPTRINQKLKTLDQYIQKYPSGWKKRLELANLLYATGDWQRAIEEYHQVIERQPQLVEVYLNLGKMLQLMGQEADAVAVYEKALSQVRHEATQQHLGGLIAVCRHDLEAAIVAFESATALEPDNMTHWLALGRLQMQKEDISGALGTFDHILSVHPNDIVALIDSYDALMILGDVGEAEVRLLRMLELAPDDCHVLKRQIETRCRMGLVWEKEGKQTKKMIDTARQRMTTVEGLALLAYYHIAREEFAEGVKILARLTEEHPINPKSWHSYGWGLFHAGQYQKAASAMETAYKLSGEDAQIYRDWCKILQAARQSQQRAKLQGRVTGV